MAAGRRRLVDQMSGDYDADCECDCCGEMVLSERIELSASPLPRECSTPELRQLSGPVSATAGAMMQVLLVRKKGAHRAPPDIRAKPVD